MLWVRHEVTGAVAGGVGSKGRLIIRKPTLGFDLVALWSGISRDLLSICGKVRSKVDECVRWKFLATLIAVSALQIRLYQEYQKSVEVDILLHSGVGWLGARLQKSGEFNHPTLTYFLDWIRWNVFETRHLTQIGCRISEIYSNFKRLHNILVTAAGVDLFVLEMPSLVLLCPAFKEELKSSPKQFPFSWVSEVEMISDCGPADCLITAWY